jgi:hypothetical protein
MFERLERCYQEDNLLSELRDHLKAPDTPMSPELAKQLRELRLTLADCALEDNKVWYLGKLWIPDKEILKEEVIQWYHDTPATGHPGYKKTYRALMESFFWPGMIDDVRRYSKNCQLCRRIKAFRDAYSGTLL